ncbi:toll/interleukin-1 receptor domain-containing protein [Fibrella aestuarina]|uniref:toll/interleukin-1 receptor domain-containing protein n=1 Tax=Fibrella aestuarina TaxID=651143 RepID=UPI00059CCBC4|nr:toll/interleukin-1 receptor domain-containing protein [Fibrella aestuarina]
MKIWITYSYEDKEFVDKIKYFLNQSDLEILDIENEILPGDNIVVAIAGAIEKADLILIILSKNSGERQWFSTEVGLIISEIRRDNHKKIIPIIKDKGSVIPPFINQYQFLDLSDEKDIDIRLEKLLKTLQIRKISEISDRKLYLESEIVLSRDELLEYEKYEYEKQRNHKQGLVITTFLTTILAFLISVFSFFISGRNVIKFGPELSISSTTIIALVLGAFIGVIISLILIQFRKK